MLMFRFDRMPGRTQLRRIVWLLLVNLPLACLAPGCVADRTAATGGQATSSLSAAAAGGADATEGGAKAYEVDCDQVDEDGNKFCLTDKDTYVGWRTFHATCHVCHGQNAVGSSFAPNLLKDIDKARFVDVVTNGYTGQVGVMPAWGQNPNVKNFIDELYAYQQARADGVLPPGRPKWKE